MMDQEELKKALAEQEERLRKEFARQKPWWNDRFNAIKGDPQTAGLLVIVTIAADRFGIPALKWAGIL